MNVRGKKGERNIKPAEALLMRSEYQKKLKNLQSRIMADLKIQGNDKPHEKPEELLKETLELHEQVGRILIKQIRFKLFTGRRIYNLWQTVGNMN